MGWLCVWLAPAFAVEVIAHPTVSVSRLSLTQAKAMFSMRQARWPDGQRAWVFVLPDNHPVHSAFSKEVLNLYPYQLRQTWDRLVFSGLGQAPIEVASEEEMLRRVASTPGAIGYVSRTTPHDRVRILTVD
ncbi:MAG: hypothetical protein RMK60_04015 [Burkholderiales bacterium]|nr:hypothetical protein [Burkholderiales bacterium]